MLAATCLECGHGLGNSYRAGLARGPGASRAPSSALLGPGTTANPRYRGAFASATYAYLLGRSRPGTQERCGTWAWAEHIRLHLNGLWLDCILSGGRALQKPRLRPPSSATCTDSASDASHGASATGDSTVISAGSHHLCQTRRVTQGDAGHARLGEMGGGTGWAPGLAVGVAAGLAAAAGAYVIYSRHGSVDGARG